jgi:aminoglycoside 3-N-acetyltransferase
MVVRVEDITDALTTLGLAGRVLEMHVSLRSFGRLDNGASTIVEGALAAGCTVVAATMTGDRFAAAAPPDDRPARNGLEYNDDDVKSADDVYDPSCTEVAAGLGSFSAHVAARPDRVRSVRTGTFAAVGPMARALMDSETSQDVYGPLRAMVEANGVVVLMGVGLTRMTLLHLAEVESGRAPFIRWMRAPQARIARVRGGECSEGFESLAEVLAPVERRTMVGESAWRIFPAAEAIDVAARAIRNDPGITHCANPGCIECADAIAGGPIE